MWLCPNIVQIDNLSRSTLVSLTDGVPGEDGVAVCVMYRVKRRQRRGSVIIQLLHVGAGRILFST